MAFLILMEGQVCAKWGDRKLLAFCARTSYCEVGGGWAVGRYPRPVVPKKEADQVRNKAHAATRSPRPTGLLRLDVPEDLTVVAV